MLNNVVLLGRLTRNVEVRYTSNEKAVGNFTLAIQRRYKNANGEYDTDFIDCTIFGKTAETLSKYSKKGDLIGVEGNLQKRVYEDKEKKKHYVTEVMIDNITFLPKQKQETKEEENPYKDMSVKVESEHKINYEEQQLPWEE